MRIKIGTGLGNIIFGMSQEKVISIMGKPDKIVETEIIQDIDYYFNNQLIKINFDKREECKLYRIEVFNPKVWLFDQQLINKEKGEILALLKLKGHYEIEQEDYETFDTVFCEEIWIEFLFKFNKLSKIAFGPLFDGGDNIIWPMEKEEPNHGWVLSENIQCLANPLPPGEPVGDNKPMEIKVGIGLDNIIFGIFQEDVINLLGKPDKILETEKEDGIVYYYNKQMIKTKFDLLENGRLYSFEVYNPRAIMFNQEIINKEKDEILDLLKLNGYCEIEQEDYEFFDTIFCKGIWSTFAFEFDKLVNVEFSPLSDTNDKIIWPMEKEEASHGWLLPENFEIFTNTSSDEECWRFFEYDDRHFVVTGEGVVF